MFLAPTVFLGVWIDLASPRERFELLARTFELADQPEDIFHIQPCATLDEQADEFEVSASGWAS